MLRSCKIGALTTVAVVFATSCGVQQTDLLIRVFDAKTQAPVAGAAVSLDTKDATSDASGAAHFLVRPNTYDVSVTHPNYVPLTRNVVVYPGTVAARSLFIQPRPDSPPNPSPGPEPLPSPGASDAPAPQPSNDAGVTIFGRVVDKSGTRLANAVVLFQLGYVTMGSATTNAQGEYRVEHLPRAQQLSATAVADGYDAVNRTVTAASEWRLDFVGAFALKQHVEPAPSAGSPTTIAVGGLIQDTHGNPMDGVVVRIESNNVRYPFNQVTVGRNGRYHMVVPTGLPLRFTAAKAFYHTTSFVDTIPASTFGGGVQEDFTGPRALEFGPLGRP